MATDWSGRTRALANFEKALKNAKRFNEEGREDLEEAVNALRRSQDHTAIQSRIKFTLAHRDELIEVLERYMAAYPAFRIKPEGALGSQVRKEQERLMSLEDCARAAIAKVIPAARMNSDG